MQPIGPRFWLDALSIVLIDVLLAGDNAVVIALAVRSLPRRQRRAGIALGAAAAAILRIAITFFAAQLLHINLVQLIGGLLILWIAVRLFSNPEAGDDARASARGLWHAAGVILIADITMSTDNVLAVAASSHGDLRLLILGLGLSIPFVVFSSDLLSRLMDRFPILVYLGAALLGRVAGAMIVTDPWLARFLPQLPGLSLAVELFFAAAVILAGRLLARLRSSVPPVPAQRP